MRVLKTEEIEFVSGGGVIEEVVVNGSSSFGAWYSSAYGVGAESYATEQAIYKTEASVDEAINALSVIIVAPVAKVPVVGPYLAAPAGFAVNTLLRANLQNEVELYREVGGQIPYLGGGF